MILALPIVTLASLPALAAPDAPVEHHLVSQDDRVYAHLERVEARLRTARVDHLSPQQQARRAELLDVLHEYRTVGVFPHNHGYQAHPRPVRVDGAFPEEPHRTPVFVDEHGTHCAVGYLLAVDGQDALVQRIVDEGNLRFVHEIDDPELLAWAHDAGFSRDDLARIQPSYGGETDEDDDGWTTDEDCDDTEPRVNPGHDEICDDGLDNDCDGLVDDDDDSCEEDDRLYCASVGTTPGLLLLALPLAALVRRRR